MKTTLLGIGNAGGNTLESIRRLSKNKEISEAKYVFADCNLETLNNHDPNGNESLVLSQDMESFPREVFDGTELLIIIAGLGGSVGSKFVKPAAIAAKEAGVPSIYIFIFESFAFEGEKRRERCKEIARDLSDIEGVNLSVFDNELALEKYGDLNFLDAFDLIDKEILIVIEDIIEKQGSI